MGITIHLKLIIIVYLFPTNLNFIIGFIAQKIIGRGFLIPPQAAQVVVWVILKSFLGTIEQNIVLVVQLDQYQNKEIRRYEIKGTGHRSFMRNWDVGV
jgi:hypothetical protein